MPEDKEVKKWQNLVKMSVKRREKQYSNLATHYVRLYTGEDWPVGTTPTEEQRININRVYGNIETQKPAVFLRDPKIFVKNKQKIIDTGVKDPLTKQPVILDGYETAKTVQGAVNSLTKEINLKDEVAKVRDDALTTQFGVMYLGYNTDFGIDDEENEYVQEESIFNQRMPPFDFLPDVELDQFDLSKARWCGREVRVSVDAVKDSPNYENTGDIEKVADVGFGELVNPDDTKSKRPVPLIQFADDEFKKSDEAKRITLYELWVKPTLKERLNPKNKFHRGKVIVMAKGHPKFLREDPWPLNIDGFPFELLTYNRVNDRFYPIADVSTYEPQLHEKNELRTAQLKQAKVAGNFKVIVAEDIWGEAEQKKLITGDNIIIPIKIEEGQDIRSKFIVVTPGSVSSEYYLVDTKVDKDIEEITNLTEIFRGTKPKGEQTATQTRIQDVRGSSKFTNRLDMTADFYIRIIRKDIQLMKQFYDIARMQEITGMDEVSWSNRWSEKKIKLEFDLDIDISNMVPTNDAVERRQALDMLAQIGQAISNPAIMAKVEEEGHDLSIVEAIKEVFKTHNIKNDKILTRLTPQQKQQKVQKRMLQQALNQRVNQPKRPPSGTPSTASESTRAQRTTAGV